MNLIQVPLPKLVPSAANVRKTGAGDIADLAASIHAHGLLQNLTVIDRGEQFEVVAGGMRLRALQDLAKRKLIAPEYSVPCNVLDAQDAHEASLTENVTRHAMHPADEFDAFNKLANGPEKSSAAEIAARFGKSERYVLQRMKLANVAPEILKEYRAGKATLEQMMAMALTDDQALQTRVWKSMKQEWQRRPDNLRRAITEKDVEASSPIAKFVGVDVYEKAGGQVLRDFFGADEDAYLTDSELLQRLALEKLERTAEKVRKEGWKWVEVRIEFDYSERNSFQIIYPDRKGNKDVWTDKMKQQAGAVITIASHNGQTEILRGLVKPEDRKAAAKSSKGKVSGGKKLSDRKPGDLSFAAVQRLQAEGGAIVASEVAKLPGLALKLLAAELADDVFYTGYDSPRTWVHIKRGGTNRMPGVVGKEATTSPRAQAFAKRETDWRARLPKKRQDLRAWIFERDLPTITELLAFLVAREIDVVDFAPKASGGKIIDLAAAASVDLAKHWKPTAEWLATLPKSTILLMVKDNGAKDLDIAKLAKLPKAELPKAAILHFQAGWLPKPLRPAIAKKPAAKEGEARSQGVSAVRACRMCGCTDNRACPGGCSWAGDLLCSACVPTIEETVTALSLVSNTEHITEDQVRGWNVDQRADAFNWAMSLHIHASDNDDVPVPPRPDFTVKAGPE